MTPADARYQAARNALIPEAAAHADRTLGKCEIAAGDPNYADKYEAWSTAWDRCFMSRMEALAKSRGIVG